MSINFKEIKSLIKAMGYLPEDGTNDIYYKKYSKHNNYVIRVNFNTLKIEYREKGLDSGIRWGDQTTSNFEKAENFVVLECIDRLLQKGYSPERLYLEYKFPLGRNEKGKLDILVFDNDNSAYLMIECKTWGAEFVKEEKKMRLSGGQLFSYYVQDRAARYLCLYASHLNGSRIEYKNNIIRAEESWSELNNQKEIYDHWNKNTKDNGIFEEWANAYDVEIKALVRNRLLPLTKDDSGRIFNQFAEILRHNVVSDKPNAFNKILNLFICKIIDEDKNDDEQMEFQWLEEDTDESLQIRLNDLYKQGMSRFLNITVTDFSDEDISDALIGVSEKSARQSIREMLVKLRLQKNPEFAFIEVYDDTSFRMNGRIVREVVELLQPYQFRYGHKQQFLGDFFELLLNTSIKQEAGQYFTPVPITRYIIASLPVKEIIEKKLEANDAEMLPAVIDFACGTGHFLTEYMDRVQSIIENEIDISKAKPIARKKLQGWIDYDKFGWAGEYVYGIDADYRLVKSAKVSSFLNGDGEANIIRANGLDNFERSSDYRGKLKLTSSEDRKDNAQFDILIANPPYSVNAFKATVKNGEESFELFDRFTDKSSEIECLFIERMKQLIKPGGYAAIILPVTVLSNSGVYIAARELMLKYFKITAITEFGTKTFMATNSNTVALFLERRNNSEYRYIENAVNNFLDRPVDAAVSGIEKAFSKYVANVYDDISLEDYITLINKNPNEAVQREELYRDYQKWFAGQAFLKKLKESGAFKQKTEEEQETAVRKLFFDKLIEYERDRILYFLLAYDQSVVITKASNKKTEKKILGYEFSNRRGYEGIKILKSGTMLFDYQNQNNPDKLNYYIYNAFLKNSSSVPPALGEIVSRVSLNSLMNYKTVVFEKNININAAKKVTFASKYKSFPLDTIAAFQDGLWKGDKGEMLLTKVLRNTNFKLNTGRLDFEDIAEIEVEAGQLESRLLIYGDILLEKSGGSPTQPVGRVRLFDYSGEEQYSFSNFCSRIRVTDDEYDPCYLWLMLNEFYILGGTIPLQNGVRLLNLKMTEYKKIRIPKPPLAIQKQIANEALSIYGAQGANSEERIKQLIDDYML